MNYTFFFPCDLCEIASRWLFVIRGSTMAECKFPDFKCCLQWKEHQDINLTDLSTAGGCGCKINPGRLKNILEKARALTQEPKFSSRLEYYNIEDQGEVNEAINLAAPKNSWGKLILNESTCDDATVFKLSNEGENEESDASSCIVSTTDFFMPIVDCPYLFGRIAATNAISDVYAMGAKPIMATAILAWPNEQKENNLTDSVISEVISGGRDACRVAGIELSGGHSIVADNPIFGLSVNGMVLEKNLKLNKGCKEGDILILTKPIGIGLITKEFKRRKKLNLNNDNEEFEDSYTKAINLMCTPNELIFDHEIRKNCLNGIHAMTDVTGFGLFGHLIEMMNSTDLVASVERIPLLHESVKNLLTEEHRTGGGIRNAMDLQNFVSCEDLTQLQKVKIAGFDPQTSGGLLMSCHKTVANELQTKYPHYKVIGRIKKKESDQNSTLIHVSSEWDL